MKQFNFVSKFENQQWLIAFKNQWKGKSCWQMLVYPKSWPSCQPNDFLRIIHLNNIKSFNGHHNIDYQPHKINQKDHIWYEVPNSITLITKRLDSNYRTGDWIAFKLSGKVLKPFIYFMKMSLICNSEFFKISNSQNRETQSEKALIYCKKFNSAEYFNNQNHHQSALHLISFVLTFIGEYSQIN